MSLPSAQSADGEAEAVRASKLGEKHFKGASNPYIYRQLLPRLDTFKIGRARWVTVASIKRLMAQLVAEKDPQKPPAPEAEEAPQLKRRRCRPEKIPAQESVT
jgi:hypothetical protein